MLLREFIKDKKVAAIAESSPFVVKQVCSEIDFQKTKTILELGSGNGTITKALLKRMHPNARLIAIEQNREFVRALTKIFDPHLTVIQDSAEHMRSILGELHVERCDVVISGIPFSMMKDEVGIQLACDMYDVLSENGICIAYQFRDTICHYLKIAGFKKIKRKIEIINLPPAQIFIAKK